jgi:hypothetical protein
MCLLRGTDWAFKESSLPFVFKRLSLRKLNKYFLTNLSKNTQSKVKTEAT